MEKNKGKGTVPCCSPCSCCPPLFEESSHPLLLFVSGDLAIQAPVLRRVYDTHPTSTESLHYPSRESWLADPVS